MLVVLVGNAFRDGSSSNFTVSTNNDCFHKQKLASLSHVRLFNFIKSIIKEITYSSISYSSLPKP